MMLFKSLYQYQEWSKIPALALGGMILRSCRLWSQERRSHILQDPSFWPSPISDPVVWTLNVAVDCRVATFPQVEDEIMAGNLEIFSSAKPFPFLSVSYVRRQLQMQIVLRHWVCKIVILMRHGMPLKYPRMLPVSEYAFFTFRHISAHTVPEKFLHRGLSLQLSFPN